MLAGAPSRGMAVCSKAGSSPQPAAHATVPRACAGPAVREAVASVTAPRRRAVGRATADACGRRMHHLAPLVHVGPVKGELLLDRLAGNDLLRASTTGRVERVRRRLSRLRRGLRLRPRRRPGRLRSGCMGSGGGRRNGRGPGRRRPVRDEIQARRCLDRCGGGLGDCGKRRHDARRRRRGSRKDPRDTQGHRQQEQSCKGNARHRATSRDVWVVAKQFALRLSSGSRRTQRRVRAPSDWPMEGLDSSASKFLLCS